MLWRISYFLLWQIAGGGLGWWQGGPWGAALGAALAAWAWFVWDLLRGARVLRWLRTGDLSDVPAMRGIWGEAADRARRLLRRQEALVRDSQDRLQEILAALQASPNGVVLLDAQGAIEWCNQTAAAHLGLDPQRDLGQAIRNMVRSPTFVAYLTEGDFGHEIQIDGPGQRPSQPNKISLQIHPYGHKRQLMLTRDVTAVQLAETMRRDFVANVSHEIRTPLTVLSGFVETMQSIPLEEVDRARYLGLMSQQAHRMQTLVNDLLTLSRLEGSPAPGNGEWVEGDDLLRQVVQEAQGLSQTIAEAPHAIDVLPGPSLQVSGVRSELLSAMSNLASNAVRYTPGGGHIRLGWRQRTDGGAEFFVSDSGPGIAAEHLPRLTERFYRVDRSRSRETGGTGLGLAIVKHVVQRHGGQVQIESVVGQGSTFTLGLPPARVRGVVSDD